MTLFNPWKGIGKQPREIWVLSASMLVNRMGTMILPFLVLYLTRSLHFSDGRAGAIFGIYGACALFASPLAGKLCDRFGPLPVMRTSLIGTGLFALAYPFVGGFWAVVGMTIGLSSFAELFRPASLTLVSLAADPENRKPAFAVTRLAINLGMSVGPALGGFIAGVSFVALFWIDGLTSLAAAVVLLVALKAPPARAEPPAAEKKPRLSFGALRDPRLAWLLAAQIPIGIVFFQIESAMPLYLVRELHFQEKFYGLLFTINTVMIVFIELPLNLATTHWSHRRTLSTGALLMGLGFGVLAIAASKWIVLLSVVGWTFGEMVLFPGLSAYVSDVSPEDRRGEYMGLYMMSFGVAFSLGPWLGTLALDHFGSTMLWLLCGVIGLLSALAMGRLPETKQGGAQNAAAL